MLLVDSQFHYVYIYGSRILFSFLNKFGQEIANTYSVKQPSETPIKVKKVKEERYRYDFGYEKRVPYQATRTTIESK